MIFNEHYFSQIFSGPISIWILHLPPFTFRISYSHRPQIIPGQLKGCSSIALSHFIFDIALTSVTWPISIHHCSEISFMNIAALSFFFWNIYDWHMKSSLFWRWERKVLFGCSVTLPTTLIPFRYSSISKEIDQAMIHLLACH